MASKFGYNVTHFFCEINGKVGGYLSSFKAPDYEVEEVTQALGPDSVTMAMLGNPKIGDAKATFNISQAGYLYEWIESIWKKNCQEAEAAVVIGDQNYNVKRRIDMMGCMIKEVSFPKLDAKDGKKHFEVSVTWEASDIAFSAGGGKIQGQLGDKAKNWLVSNFDPIGMPGGIDGAFVTAIEMPKLSAKVASESHGPRRLPTRHYAAYEIKGLKTEHSSHGYEKVRDLCLKVIKDGNVSESDFVTWGVDIKDQSLKKTLGSAQFEGTLPRKLSWAPELKGGQDAMATCTVEWMIEGFEFKNQHKFL